MVSKASIFENCTGIELKTIIEKRNKNRIEDLVNRVDEKKCEVS